jgi:DNA-binding transcriptional ArsR family regulator
MFKEAYHPKAHLSSIKNIRLGLQARTRILNVLDKRSVDAKTIAKETGMHYGVVMHHLRLLEAEGIIERKQSKPHIWVVTGLGQKRLVNLS